MSRFDHRRLVAVLVAIAFLSGASCAPEPELPPNVVIIVIDTLRADHLSFYGYEKDTAPFLESLAEQGVVFETARSTSSWTAPGTASIVTSLNPVQHGVHRGLMAVRMLKQVDPTVTVDRIPDAAVTAAEAFREAGYSTWGVSDNLNIGYEEGFDQGFDRFRTSNDAGAATLNATALRWSEDIMDAEPYLLYLHYMDPHRPYVKRSPWYQPREGELLDSISAYDSEINYVDTKVQELFERFGWSENTIVVVTSDHGEEFLEHEGWDHGRTLYEEVLRVPLFFYAPGESLAVGRVEEPVSVLDILPTLRSLAGLPSSPAEEGLDLEPALRGEGRPAHDRLFFSDLRSPPWFGSQTLKSVTRGDDKYILTAPDAEELYDLASDPEEQESRPEERRDLAEELRGELERFESQCVRYTHEDAEFELGEEDLEKLEALGYVN